MTGRHIEDRTLGELAAMRDTLQVAREDLTRGYQIGGEYHDRRLYDAVSGILAVLESIVDGSPFYSTPRVRERRAYRPNPQ